MDQFLATELAYKKGYEDGKARGYAESRQEINEDVEKFLKENLSILLHKLADELK